MSEAQVTLIVTPWRSHPALLKLRDDLFLSRDNARLDSNLRLIDTWKLRGNLPHAIESTGLLLQARTFHQSQDRLSLSPGETRSPSIFPIRAAYTVALTRFVTGYADIGRHKSGPGQSMLEVAMTVGLPIHFVELRHEATHGEMPSLDRLVDLTDQAIKWLWETYWSKLEQGKQDLRGEPRAHEHQLRELKTPKTDHQSQEELEGSVRSTLKEFRRMAKSYVQQGQMVGREQAQVYSEELRSQADSIRGGHRILARVICSPGFMISSDGNISNLSKQMQTACAIFEPLLLLLAESSNKFMKAVLRQIVVQSTTRKDVGDSASAGLLEWCRRFFEEPQWTDVLGDRHRDLVVYYCRLVIEHADEPQEKRFAAPTKQSLKDLYPQDHAWWRRVTNTSQDADMADAAM